MLRVLLAADKHRANSMVESLGARLIELNKVERGPGLALVAVVANKKFRVVQLKATDANLVELAGLDERESPVHVFVHPSACALVFSEEAMPPLACLNDAASQGGAEDNE